MDEKKRIADELKQKACFLRISIPYDNDDNLISFDDGIMTELECDDDFTPPMLDKENQLLDFLIDLKERKMIGRTDSYGYIRMCAKVCDSGTYTLLNADKQPIWQLCGYVPNKLVPPLDKGFGDYIELAIHENGFIEGWPEIPDFSDFVEKGHLPQPIKTNKWHRAEEALWKVKDLHLKKEETEWLIDKLGEELS